MTRAATAAVREQVLVEAPQERAFTVFTQHFGDFEPREHNIMASPIARTVFEPWVGAHIVDTAEDGSECRCARVLAYEPHERATDQGMAAAPGPLRPQWQAGVVRGHMADGGPEVGARCTTVRRIGGAAERASSSELVHVDPPRTWGVRGIDGPIRARVDVTVEPLGDDRPRVSIAVDLAGRGIGRLLVPLVVRREAAREMPADLARLKERLEQRTG